MAPQFIYGWSSFGNTLVAVGSLDSADQSYTKAIELCNEYLSEENGSLESKSLLSSPSCKKDLYLFYLNRGAVRLNNHRLQDSLKDLNLAAQLRGREDPIILQNRARAYEMNELYAMADKDYSVAISMTSDVVVPFWLRSSLVKFELGDLTGAWSLAQRVANKFPEAPEVRAAIAVLMWARGDEEAARKKFLEIPDRARRKYSDTSYLKDTIAWGPKMTETLFVVSRAVGDFDSRRDINP